MLKSSKNWFKPFPPKWWCKTQRETKWLVEQEESLEEKLQPQKGIFCARCLAYICSAQDKIEVQGKHLHHFFNPQGLVFEIGCFAKAPGCQGVGPFTQEFSWFYPYFWQVCLCKHCTSHLGWIYSYQEDIFYGLILGRLLEK